MRSGDRGHNNPLGYLTDNRFVFKRKGNTTLAGNGLTVAKGSGLGQNKSGMGSLPEVSTHATPRHLLTTQAGSNSSFRGHYQNRQNTRIDPSEEEMPITVKYLLAHEQMQLMQPSKVFCKYLQMAEGCSVDFKLKLLENVRQAHEKLNSSDSNEVFRRNYPILHDFFAKLRYGVKKRKRNNENFEKFLQRQETLKKEKRSPTSETKLSKFGSESSKMGSSPKGSLARIELRPIMKKPTLILSPSKGGRNWPAPAPIIIPHKVLTEPDEPLELDNLSKNALSVNSPGPRSSCIATKISGENKFSMQIKLIMKKIHYSDQGKSELPAKLKEFGLVDADTPSLKKDKQRAEIRRLREKVKQIDEKKDQGKDPATATSPEQKEELLVKKIIGNSRRHHKNYFEKDRKPSENLEICKMVGIDTQYGKNLTEIREITSQAKREVNRQLQRLGNCRSDPDIGRKEKVDKVTVVEGPSFPQGSSLSHSHRNNDSFEELDDNMLFNSIAQYKLTLIEIDREYTPSKKDERDYWQGRLDSAMKEIDKNINRWDE